MDRIPRWVLIVAAVLFVGLAAWSANDENWAGLIIGGVLAALCVAAIFRPPGTPNPPG